MFWWAKAWCDLMQCGGCKIQAQQPFLTMGCQLHISLSLSSNITPIAFWLNISCLLLSEKWNRALEKIVVLLHWIAVIYVHAKRNEEMQIPPASRFAYQPLWGHCFISWIVELIWPCALQHHMRYVLIGLKGMACCDLILFTFMYISPCLL